MPTKLTGTFKPPGQTEPGTFRNVVAAAYTAYIAYRRVPSVEDIAEFSEHRASTISRIIATDEFKIAIEARGVRWQTMLGGISAEQHYAISILFNPTDRRPLAAKLKSAGVTYAKYKAWLKEPTFNNFVQQNAEQMLTDHQADIHTAFLNKAMTGDLPAVKFYYELTGRHSPQANQVIDLQRVVGLLLESVSKHVTDPETLLKITVDFAGAMPRGTTVPGSVVTTEPSPKPIEGFQL